MMRIAILFALAFGLISCTHLLIDSTERLQLRNLSDETISDFSVVGSNDTLLWISETVLPGEQSHVFEKDLVGKFHVIFTAEDSSGNAQIVELGKLHFSGGSELLEISKTDSGWKAHFK